MLGARDTNGRATPPPDERPLKRSLGLTMATALVVGNMVGSGVFLLPAASPARQAPCRSSPGADGRRGDAARARLRQTWAGPTRRRAGPTRTRGALSATSSASRPPGATGSQPGPATPRSRSHSSATWPSSGRAGRTSCSPRSWRSAVIWLLTGSTSLGVRESGWVQLVTTVLKFVPLVLIGARSGCSSSTPTTSPVQRRRRSATGTSAPRRRSTLLAFIGLESATVPAEEVKDPERTIPRATILGTLVTTRRLHARDRRRDRGSSPPASWPSRRARSRMPPARCSAAGLGTVIALVAMISAVGALNGWILLQGQIPLAAAEDGLFPKRSPRVHGTRRTPVFGLVVSSAAGHRARVHELQREPGRPVHAGAAARDADDARAVRLLGGGAGGHVLP